MVAGKEKGAKGAAKSKQAKDEKSADDTVNHLSIRNECTCFVASVSKN